MRDIDLLRYDLETLLARCALCREHYLSNIALILDGEVDLAEWQVGMVLFELQRFHHQQHVL